MSIEQQPKSHETNEQAKAELEALGKERMLELGIKAPEASAEHQEKRAEAAREVISHHELAPEPAPAAEAPPAATSPFAARLDILANYTQTMQSLQKHLSPVSRTFSQVIHYTAVEKASEALETTVMRPSVIAGALWSAAIVGLGFYLVARHFGYAMSGSEMLVSLLAGGIIGGLLEAGARAARGRRA
jgi:hypothetical protein